MDKIYIVGRIIKDLDGIEYCVNSLHTTYDKAFTELKEIFLRDHRHCMKNKKLYKARFNIDDNKIVITNNVLDYTAIVRIVEAPLDTQIYLQHILKEG